MQLRPEVQIASMIKAMKDVVIPALGNSNKLASEQAGLIVGMLHQMSVQLPVQYRFDRDELGRLLGTTDELLAVPVKDDNARQAQQALGALRGDAEQVLQGCQRDPDDLRAAVFALKERVCQVIDTLAASSDVDSQLKVEKIVLSMSKEQLLRDRALVKAQGWEPDPAAVPAIAQLLA
ncbi:MAG TPA: hypothetical protein VFY31_01475 [Macromonas sp.]|nr:hypothetical protein [Macromonas sp.]